MHTEVLLATRLFEQGDLPPDERPNVLRALTRAPSLEQWAAFLHVVGLGLGAALVASGVLYLVAFNWSLMGVIPRLASVFAAVALAAAGSVAVGPWTTAGKALGVVAAMFVGAALVVYSQLYQTGADTWQLFACWAVLASPFVFATGSTGAWALLIVLVDLTVSGLISDLTISDLPWQATTFSLAVAHLVLAQAWPDRWLQHAVRGFGALLLTLNACLYAGHDHYDTAAAAAALVAGGGAVTQVAYAFGYVRSPAAATAGAALSALLMTVLYRTLDSAHVSWAGSLLAFGGALAVLCVGGAGWLRFWRSS